MRSPTSDDNCCQQPLAHADCTHRTEVEANVHALIAPRYKLQKGMDRFIDSLAEGAIEKE
jgi:hypothetical protein